MERVALLLITTLLLCSYSSQAISDPVVVDGIIDLSDWNFERDGPVNLTGDYEFYWNQHLNSQDFFQLETSSSTKLFVPGAWNNTIVDNQELDGFGFATYRLNVLTTERLPMALKIPDMGTAFRLIVDGNALLQVGTPGRDRASTVPKYNPAVIPFTPRSGRIEIIIQISNYHHRLGGPWLPLYIGKPAQLIELREFQLARDLILFGAILIIGLYNLALFTLRPEARSSLFLGLFCLLLAIRQLMVGDRFMTRLFTEMPFEWYIRIEYLGWYLAVSTFTAFLHNIFQQEFPRYAANTVHAIFGIGALVVALTPAYFFSFTVPIYQMLTVIALSYGAFVLVLSSIRKREGALLLLFAYSVLFVTVISDVLVNAGIFDNILLLDVGLFVFILCQSILISYRFTRTFKTVETQRAQLEATNLKLRTQEKLRRDAEVESEALHKRIAQSEKMEAIGLLAGGVAHDLNNILSTTVTYPEIALLDLPEDSPLANPLALTKRAGLRAAAVIQDLLTLARRGVVQREVVSLNDVIEEYLDSVEHKLILSNSSAIRIHTNLSSDLSHIEGSPTNLTKLVMNLVVNAVEAQTEGGSVSITTHNEHLDEQLHLFYGDINAGDHVVLSIEDEGRGIDPDDLEKLFEPFYTTKVMGQSGTGLGMSVVWGVVYDHEGAIDVMSLPGEGTRFDVYLPATKKPAPVRPKAQPIQNLLGSKERILVVDDVADQRDLTTAALERLNYEVHTSASGKEAVTRLREEDFDLIIIDMVMDSGWDGLETYSEIKKLRADAKTLLISGFAETTQVTEAQKLGAGSFVRKPFTLESIGTAIKDVLESP